MEFQSEKATTSAKVAQQLLCDDKLEELIPHGVARLSTSISLRHGPQLHS